MSLARYLAIVRLSFVIGKYFMLGFLKSEHRCYIIFMCQRALFYRHTFSRFLGWINLRGGKPCSGIADIRHRSYRYKLHYLEPFYSDFGLWSHGQAWQTVDANQDMELRSSSGDIPILYKWNSDDSYFSVPLFVHLLYLECQITTGGDCLFLGAWILSSDLIFVLYDTNTE